MSASFKKEITLKEFVERFKDYKEEYNRVRHNTIAVIEWRGYIFALKEKYYIKVKMWEALNDDITKNELDKFVKGVYTGR